ncbi:hypothetical protein IB286_12835 [Spongiibacter sp. KMU-158]|uniref:Scaffold protein FimL second domain-containing protein n=1 Tax=Spongiibacter pelagi TaxID=2760804 RepID=A0A927C247_9GAMM|nr:hypothetical protein [Spongiibacter pelagi]MBD2859888.1 hypothetical protein [Spongiibacter pelagi]
MQLDTNINSQSFGLVADELNSTLQQATHVFESYLAERHDLGLIRQCEMELRQIGGTLRLLEVPGAALLADEMRNLCGAVLQDEGEHIEAKLNALSTAFFILPRYLEFIQSRGSDVPLMAITYANDLRVLHGQLPLFDGYFNATDGWLLSRDVKLKVRSQALENKAFDNALKPIRQLFQTGLLGLLRDSQPEMQFTIMNRALRRLCAILPNGQAQTFWLLASSVLECFIQQGLSLSPHRKRLFSGLEGLLRGSSSEDLRLNPILEHEIVFLLQLSAWQEGMGGKLLKAAKLTPTTLNDQQIDDLRRQMLGINYETVSTVLQELRVELRHGKDMLELLTQHQRSDEDEILPLTSLLTQIGEVLKVLNLPSLGETLASYAAKLKGLIGSDLSVHFGELESLAETLLFIDNSLAQIDRRKLNYSDLDNLTLEARENINVASLVDEAKLLAIAESKDAVTMAKRAIASYIESGLDVGHITNLPQTLNSVRGFFAIVQLPKAEAIGRQAVNFIKHYLETEETDLSQQQHARSLEMLADALISLEYYLADMERHHLGDEKILQIAEQSLTELGFPPRAAA